MSWRGTKKPEEKAQNDRKQSFHSNSGREQKAPQFRFNWAQSKEVTFLVS